jgi:hypothetical protein
VGSGFFSLEKWGSDVRSPVPLAKRVVYLIDRLWGSQIEGVIVVVCLVIREKSCEV